MDVRRLRVVTRHELRRHHPALVINRRGRVENVLVEGDVEAVEFREQTVRGGQFAPGADEDADVGVTKPDVWIRDGRGAQAQVHQTFFA